MIAHPPQLDAAYGTAPVAPWARLTFTDPSGKVRTATPIDGTLTHDATSWPRTVLSVRVPTAATPADTIAPATPFGGTVALDLGATVAGQLYTFRAATLDVTTVTLDRPESVFTIEAASGEAKVNEDRITTPVTLPVGTDIAQYGAGLVKAVLGASWPVSRRETGNRSTTQADEFIIDGDRWQLVENLADAIGAEFWFDPASQTLVVSDQPRVGAPSLTLRGGNGGTLTAYTWRQQWAPNRVVVRTHLLDTDTYRLGTWSEPSGSAVAPGGAYGTHTRLIELKDRKLAAGAPTTGQLNSWAASRARRERSAFRSLSVRAIPAPWLIPGDTVRVNLLGASTWTMLARRVEIPITQLDAMVLELEDDATTAAPA